MSPAAVEAFGLIDHVSGTAVVVADTSGRVRWATNKALDWAGRNLSDLRGTHVHDFVRPIEAAAYNDSWFDSLARGDGVREVVVDVTSGVERTRRRMRIGKAQAFGSEEPAIFLFLAPMSTEAEEATDSSRMAQFLNAAAHELNTPLTPLVLQISTMRRIVRDTDPRVQQGFDRLDRSIQRLRFLTQDILDAARTRSGRFELSMQDIDLTLMLSDLKADFAPPAKEHKTELSIDAIGDLRVRADPTRLYQVLFNLVDNAFRFTQPNGNVHVTARAIDDRVKVSVTDDGRGMDPGSIHELFQPFSQIHDEPPRGRGGTGLGLYISRNIIHFHGGQIRATSPGKGKGSTFEFWLPKRGISGVAADMDAVESVQERERLARDDEFTRRVQNLV